MFFFQFFFQFLYMDVSYIWIIFKKKFWACRRIRYIIEQRNIDTKLLYFTNMWVSAERDGETSFANNNSRRMSERKISRVFFLCWRGYPKVPFTWRGRITRVFFYIKRQGGKWVLDFITRTTELKFRQITCYFACCFSVYLTQFRPKLSTYPPQYSIGWEWYFSTVVAEAADDLQPTLCRH